MTRTGGSTVDERAEDTKPRSPDAAKIKKISTLALEIPFTIVGAVLLGGLLGYFLDHWLHTKVVFMLILGGLGFAAGLKDALRRLS